MMRTRHERAESSAMWLLVFRHRSIAFLCAFALAPGSTTEARKPPARPPLAELRPEEFVAEVCRELVSVQHVPFAFAQLMGVGQPQAREGERYPAHPDKNSQLKQFREEARR